MATGKELWLAFKNAIWALSLPAFIIYGIRGGVFTPTEAGAIAVLYSIFVGVFLHRELSWKNIPEILSESVKSTATIMIIICGAATFGYYMVWENIPSGIATFLTGITNSPGLMLLIINVLLLLLGMVIEGTAAMILLTPILAPVVLALGIDPIHFGVVMVFNLTLGGVTPPVGTLLFTASNVLKVPLISTIKESLPLLFALLVLLALLTIFPQISLFLPSILMPA
jgi:tripartite ATP-independent transporter DctM subunit